VEPCPTVAKRLHLLRWVIRLDRCDDHTGFDGDEIDAHERDAHPCVDDDALIQDAIQYVNTGGRECE
jgi:hypothetical protein